MSQNNVKLFRKIAQDSLEQCHRMHAGCNEIFTFFIEALITTLELRQIFTVDGLKNITSDRFMGNSQYRSFLLTYETVFFANLGDKHALYRELYETIADAVCVYKPVDGTDIDKVLLSSEVTDQLATYEEAVEVMIHNRWITSMMALILWTVPVYEFYTMRVGGEDKTILRKVTKNTDGQ